MTYDHDSKELVVRSVESIMDSYGKGQPGDALWLFQALTEATKKLGLALKKGRIDEARGVANRLDDMTSRLSTVLKYDSHGES